jgi:hypothetical protein
MNDEQIKREFKIEFEMMNLIVNEVEKLINDIDDNEPTNVQKAAIGAFAAQFFNGIENLFKRIFKYYQLDLPKGENWHIELINSFSNNSNIILPIKLSQDLISEIHNYRRFRHYFIHGYTFTLNWSIVKDSLKNIRIIYNDIKFSFSKSF